MGPAAGVGSMAYADTSALGMIGGPGRPGEHQPGREAGHDLCSVESFSRWVEHTFAAGVDVLAGLQAGRASFLERAQVYPDLAGAPASSSPNG